MSHHLVKTRSSEWELTTAFTKGRGLATATEMCLQKWFCVVSIFKANNLLWSNVGELSWSWILKNNISRFRKRRKFRHGLFTSSLKREVTHFHVVVVQWWQRNVQKSVLHVQCCFFCLLNLLMLWHSGYHYCHLILRPVVFLSWTGCGCLWCRAWGSGCQRSHGM